LKPFLADEDAPTGFPLGGCFGYWGYGLRHFVGERLSCRAAADPGFPDCSAGFHDSLAIFDHADRCAWIVSTGLGPDGRRGESRARDRLVFWKRLIAEAAQAPAPAGAEDSHAAGDALPPEFRSNLTRAAFMAAVRKAQDYIRAGDIYQVNLSQRFEAPWQRGAWDFFERLNGISPAPYSGYYDGGSFQIACASPESFLHMQGRRATTRPIKGTRPRAFEAIEDARLAEELQSSPKERAELLMITDLLRNDLGRICEFGSIQVPELIRLERYAQVQHLVSTVTGQLRGDLSHLQALARCFPGGSVTGAPKLRAMDIIDELEPVSRGPYTGSLGYVGFNGLSQMNILIRSAYCLPGRLYYHAGAGIVADSDPAAEYEETLAKSRAFFEAATSRHDGAAVET
jgi:para-aminobenzoate synthetase component 1